VQLLPIVEGILGSLAAALAYDYLSVTGSAARCTSFDYRYLPLSRLRLATIGMLAAAAFYGFLRYRPEDPPILPLILGMAALVIHGIVSILDVFAQRRTGYRVPPNYGEREI